MANPYAMGPLYHSPGVQSYCTPSDNLSLAGHYTDMRNSASWYGTSANDPRFASEYTFCFSFKVIVSTSLCTLNDVCKKRVAVAIRALTSTLNVQNGRKKFKEFCGKKTDDKL
jgi:hypothetical protein